MAQKRISDFFGGPNKSKKSCITSVDESGTVALLSSEDDEEEEGVESPRPRADDDPSSSGVQPAEPGPSLPAPAARASTTMPSLASLEKPFQPSTVCAAYVMLDYLCWGRTAHSPLCAVTSGRATAAVPVFVCHSASPVSALYTICFVFYINRQCASALYFDNDALPYCV